MSSNLRSVLRLKVGTVAGAFVSALLLASIFFDVHVHHGSLQLVSRFSIATFFRAVPGQLGWVAVFAVLTAAMAPLRAMQWQRTLTQPVPFRERYHLVAIAGLCNNILPGKLGDGVRAWLLARRRRITFVASLGSVLVCKLLEATVLVVLLAVSLIGPAHQPLSRFSRAIDPVIVGCLALVALAVATAHYARPLAYWLARRRKMPKVRHFLGEIGEGLGTAKSLPGMGVALLFSIGPVVAPALGYGLGLRAMGVPEGLMLGAAVLAALSLGQSVIAIPAGAGVYYFVAGWAARSLGATADQAAVYAVLTHLATALTQVGMGAVSVWALHLRWADLKDKLRLAARAAQHVQSEVVET